LGSIHCLQQPSDLSFAIDIGEKRLRTPRLGSWHDKRGHLITESPEIKKAHECGVIVSPRGGSNLASVQVLDYGTRAYIAQVGILFSTTKRGQ